MLMQALIHSRICSGRFCTYQQVSLTAAPTYKKIGCLINLLDKLNFSGIR